MIKSAPALRDRLDLGQIAQRITGRQIIITETNERVSLTAIKTCLKKGWAEAFPADLFGDDLSAWRKPGCR